MILLVRSKRHIILLVLLLCVFCCQTKRTNSDLIQKLEQSMLDISGLKQVPHIDQSMKVVPDNIMQMYHSIHDLNTAESVPTTTLYSSSITSFIPEATSMKAIASRENNDDFALYPENSRRFVFDISNLNSSKDIHLQSYLILWHKKSSGPMCLQYKVNLYDILSRVGSRGKPELILADTKEITKTKFDWSQPVQMNMTEVVKRWLVESDSSNNGILLRVEVSHQCNGNQPLLLRPFVRPSPENEWIKNRPRLFFYTREVGSDLSRKVRRTHKVYGIRQSTQCHRKPMRIEFGMFGWDSWIIAPKYYEAYHCHGECDGFPLPKHLNTTNHAVVQNIIHSSRRLSVPPPCCVSTTYSPLSLIYIANNNTIILKSFSNMIVDSCGCR